MDVALLERNITTNEGDHRGSSLRPVRLDGVLAIAEARLKVVKMLPRRTVPYPQSDAALKMRALVPEATWAAFLFTLARILRHIATGAS